MRRALFLGLGSALLLLSMGGVGAARADNGPHVSNVPGVSVFDQATGTDRCVHCHRIYTARGASQLTTRQDGLCLTCHGPSAAGASTDVIDGVGYGVNGTQNGARNTAPAALRGGGFDYARIGSGTITKESYLIGTSLGARHQVIPVLALGKATTSSHASTTTHNANGFIDTGQSNGPSAGSEAAVTLHCGSCHNPHGNGNYRVLRTIPAYSGVSTSAVGVAIPDASVKVYTTTNYWLSGDVSVPPVVNGVNVGTAIPDGYIGNIAHWCTTCHTQHHSTANDKMGERNCVTCHVAHGSNASMDGSAEPHGSNSSSRLLRVDNRATCLLCHNR